MAVVGWRLRRLAWVLLAVLWVAAVSQGPAQAEDRSAYRLGSGDKIKVTVFNEEDLSGEFQVNDQGAVSLPLIGQVDVAGKTLTEVQTVVTQKYGENYLVNPRVSVEVMNYRPFFILGEVKNPGSYPYVNGMTVINAVALAGGYTPRADKKRIELKRADGNGAERTVSEDAAVMPGDVLRVAERFF